MTDPKEGDMEPDRRCYADGCVATWKHWHGFLPGGYDNPEDPEGVPILFTDPEPTLPPGWCRDYNGAPLPPIEDVLIAGGRHGTPK